MTFTRPLLLAGVLLLAACNNGASNGYGDDSGSDTSSGAVACTLEAKLCPDGSYVGRSGPNCEFSPCPGEPTSSSTGATSLQSVSDGTISFSYPSDFGLAISKEQILVSAYIPPCDEGFNYCLYSNGSQYAGTNFESAGIAVSNRTDLASESDCLSKQPNGYGNLTPIIRDNGEYKTSVFSPLGDAGMGHYAHDRLYRLAIGGSCYEFTTRIGSTQFANFPAGTVREFTTADEQMLQTQLDSILGGFTLKSGEKIALPEVPGVPAH